MAVEAPTPLPWRASDRERDSVVRALRASTVEGRISTDTFVRRLECAYRARSRLELEELLRDLPPSGPLERLSLRLVARVAALRSTLELAWRTEQLPVLPLPPASVEILLGRSRECGVPLGDETISRRHALIRREHGRWLVRDLSSLNGTRVNGMPVIGETELRPGDRLALGPHEFRVSVGP